MSLQQTQVLEVDFAATRESPPGEGPARFVRAWNAALNAACAGFIALSDSAQYRKTAWL
jgi:hypothetical protein